MGSRERQEGVRGGPPLTALEWLGRFMALVSKKPFDRNTRDAAQRAKEALAAYRGLACGVRYAEAVWALNPSPRDIL